MSMSSWYTVPGVSTKTCLTTKPDREKEYSCRATSPEARERTCRLSPGPALYRLVPLQEGEVEGRFEIDDGTEDRVAAGKAAGVLDLVLEPVGPGLVGPGPPWSAAGCRARPRTSWEKPAPGPRNARAPAAGPDRRSRRRDGPWSALRSRPPNPARRGPAGADRDRPGSEGVAGPGIEGEFAGVLQSGTSRKAMDLAQG